MISSKYPGVSHSPRHASTRKRHRLLWLLPALAWGSGSGPCWWMPALTAMAVWRHRRYGEVWMMILRFRLGAAV